MTEDLKGGTVRTAEAESPEPWEEAMSPQPQACRRRMSQQDSHPLHSSPSEPRLLGILPVGFPPPSSSTRSLINLKEGTWDFQAAKLGKVMGSSCHKEQEGGDRAFLLSHKSP